MKGRRVMQKRLGWICVALLFVLCACGKTNPPAAVSGRTDPETAQTEEQPLQTDAQAGEPADASASETAEAVSEATERPSSTIRTLPGHIASDVFVHRLDADVAPGLRADDAQTVRQLLAAQTWGPGYDNLSNVEIHVLTARYTYESDSGILTTETGDAVKLSDSERVRLNTILRQYIDLSEPIDYASRAG